MKKLTEIRSIVNKAVQQGGRLSLEEGAALMASPDLLLLGRAASLVRQKMHPEPVVTFVIDRNINYTNVCLSRCKFCAFYREEGDPESYVLSKAELMSKVAGTVKAGGSSVMIQGGLHPGLGLYYCLDMFRAIKEKYPVHIHSLSPPEIMHLTRMSGLSVREVLRSLRAAGLDTLPGGGAEILVDRVRQLISPDKISWREWISVMEEAHKAGLKSTATMMFGHLESHEERVLHMLRIREQQDRTGGFTAFIPWSYQPKNTRLGGVETTGVDYLKTMAVARLMLDNISNIQVSWVTQGSALAQVALSFGANDFGSTMLEENVVRAAGVDYRVPLEEIVRCIKTAGFRPALRNPRYEILRRFN